MSQQAKGRAPNGTKDALKFNPVRDVISGAIMAATSVPQLIAYAETVGYAGYLGLATAGPPLLAWGLATGSPWMNSGVTSLTAVMAKNDLGGEAYVAEYGEEEYVRLVAAYSLVVGVVSIAMAAVGFGKLAQKAPKPVVTGFKWGCEVGVLSSALPNGLYAFGSTLKKIVGESELGAVVASVKVAAPAATGFGGVSNVLYAVTHPHTWDPVAAIIFLACTTFVMQAKKFMPKSMPPGAEVVIATAAATAYSVYSGYSGGVVGEIPAMDSSAGMSLFGGRLHVPIKVLDVRGLLDVPLLARCFDHSLPRLLLTAGIFSGVNFLSIVGIASGFEAENGVAWSAPRELIAQGVSNLAAGAVGSAPVSGSMSRSLVSRMTGASSKLACIITALLWIYMMPYMSIMTPTPKAALSAVIVSAVVKNVVLPRKILALKGTDFCVGAGTAAITALTNPTLGFGIGLVVYLLISAVLGAGTEEKKKKTE